MNSCLFVKYNGKKLILARCNTADISIEKERIRAMTNLPLINSEASLGKKIGMLHHNMLTIKENQPSYMLMKLSQAEYFTNNYTLGNLLKAYPRGIQSKDLKRL